MSDRKVKRLFDQLLSEVPEIRHGNNYAAIKAQSWFSNFFWDELCNKEIHVTFKPISDKIISQSIETLTCLTKTANEE